MQKVTDKFGDGMAEMLANALFATNRFIVLERQSLDDVLREQDLGASGRVRKETAARIGEIEGADLLIDSIAGKKWKIEPSPFLLAFSPFSHHNLYKYKTSTLK